MKRPKVRYKFGARIRALRKRNKWTQEELADRADITYKHIQRLEGRTPSPAKIDTIEKIAKAFKISCSELMDF